MLSSLLAYAILTLSHQSFIGEAHPDPARRQPNLETLRFVHVVWRHGDRNPAVGVFPTDTENPAETWPPGYGELTTLGALNHFQLGRWLKQRYRGFLSEKYSPGEIYVRSTDYNRTLASAYANLAGFYRDSSPRWFNNSITGNFSWSPVPVHTVPMEKDHILAVMSTCPEADKFFKEMEQSAEFNQFVAENKEIFDYFSSQSGWSITKLEDVWSVFDPLNCEYSHPESHTPPLWAVPSLVQEFSDIYYESTKFYFNSFQWQKFRGGPLLNEIVDRMKAIVADTNGTNRPNLKYYAYSAHDHTLVALMQCLDCFNIRFLPYGSALLFELHQVGEEYVVEIFLHNTMLTNSSLAPPPHPMIVPGCSHHPCSLDKISVIAERLRVDDWFEECGLNQSDSELMWKGLAIGFIVLFILTGLVLVLVSIWFGLTLKRRKGYTKLDDTES